MSSQTVPKSTVRQRPAGMRTIVVSALLLHIPLFIYPVLRLASWLELSQLATLFVLVPVASSQIISRSLLRNPGHFMIRRLRQTLDLLLGMSPVVLLLLLAAEMFVLVGVIPGKLAAQLVLMVAGAVTFVGIGLAFRPAVKTVSFSSDGLRAPLKFVQITDVHIGSRSARFLRRVTDQIRQLDPEFVCITGDFIDAWGVPTSDLVSLRDLNCPVYLCTGNHERYEDLEAIIDRLGEVGVQTLRSQSAMPRADVQVVGIDDRDDALQVSRELPKINLADDVFRILMYHRPHGLNSAAKAGIHLMLSGHTHNGQIFPFNLLVKRVFERLAGMYELDGARLYVSQGTGTWGPVMRVGTRSEITLFEIKSIEPKGYENG